MHYSAASYGVAEGSCFAWLSMTSSTLRRAQGRPEDDRGATKLRVMVREIEPWQTNVMLRLKAEDLSFFEETQKIVEEDFARVPVRVGTWERYPEL